MADEPVHPKLKPKSKWGKLLSKDKSDKGHFKLNEDVVDFLKPSTDKYSEAGTRQWSSAPRIDVAITQRWPDAADVRRAAGAADVAGSGPDPRSNARPKRRKNLTVSFAKTAPEIIGEGGDETEVPVIEISRLKATRLRSVSDRRPPPLNTAVADEHRQPASNPLSAPPQDPYAKPDIQRSKTSAGETAYQRQRMIARLPQPLSQPQSQSQPQSRTLDGNDHIIAAPPNEEPRPGMLKRAPTGFSAYEQDITPTSPDAMSPAVPQLPLSLPTRPMSTEWRPRDSTGSLEAVIRHLREPSSPIDTVSHPPSNPFVAKAQNRLEAEGRTFRRVSRQVFSEDDVADLRSISSGEMGSSPPRVSPATQQLALQAAQEYQALTEGYHSPEPEVEWHSVRSNPSLDDANADSVRSEPSIPESPPTLPLLAHQMEKSGSSLPKRSDEMYIPRINTTFEPSSPEIETGLAPHDHNTFEHGDRSPAHAVSLDPNTSHLPSSNRLQPLVGTQPIHQGITPTPTQEPAGSYFAPRPPQAVNRNAISPSIPAAASPSVSSEPHHPHARPPSQGSHYKAFTPIENQPESAESLAYADFDARVAHMRGVFRLTAEREHPISTVSRQQWLRAAIWWLHKGRAGLGQVVRNIPRGPDGQKRELLTQPHVDVAKTWWILTDPLGDVGSPQSDHRQDQDHFSREVDMIRTHLRSLALSMQRNGVMPPHQSLIQGQDTTIWLRYPRFAPDAASLLRGSTSLMVEDQQSDTDPLEALPAGDSKTAFFYNRMFVNVSVNTDDAETDRVVLPCILTMMRARSDFQPTIIVSTQIDLVNVRVKPGDGGHGKGPTWHDVSWKARSHGLYIRLPRGFNLSIELQETDFRGLWNMVEYTRNLEASLKPQAGEKLVHEARLAELRYSDSSNAHAFPKDKVRSCSALVFERGMTQSQGTGARRFHRSFRLLLITNPVNKTLSSVSHELCKASPLLFEMVGNPTANEAPALVIHVREAKRSCKAVLGFGHASERQQLFNTLNGITLSPNEAIVGQASLRNCSIKPASVNTPGSIPPGDGSLESLRWDSVRIVNKPIGGGQDPGSTVLSENLRIIASHESGSFTDRINLGPGELLIRLPIQQPTTLQFLRGPQEDMTMSIDTRRCQPQLIQDMSELMRIVISKPTIRSLTFASISDLHAFQTAITRHTVRYDSAASFFAISRRRMVVPIYKKLETNQVRLQVLTQGNVTQIAAFFEDFSYADAMVFQVKPSDVFEKVKGEKGAKYGIKLVDAKFTLPKKEKDVEGAEPESMDGEWPRGVRRRFINMEGLEYAEEHDDITIGFEREEERDRFCEQLPAATTTKKFDLRRKI